MLPINPSVACIETPPIPEAHAWAARYDGAHGPAIDMCQAVPGWAPHPELLARLAAAAADPASARYGLIDGDLELREAYAHELSSAYAGNIAADQVAITAGCNQAFFLAMLTLATPGDNVLLPLPWFWNHQQSCAMLGLEPRALPCRAEDAFVPDAETAERLVDARTRAIVLITPNNPTGAVYQPETIARFHDLCRRRGLWLILDETYRDFLPDGQPRAHDLFQRSDWPENLIQLYSFSKSYSAPGARVGAVTAATPLIAQFIKALDCLHICPQRPAQQALAWAIPALQDWRAENRARINARAAAFRDALAKLPSWRIDSLGAYFAYVRHPFPGTPAPRIAERLATAMGVTALPGTAFGPAQDTHLRLAFANTTLPQLATLADRLNQCELSPSPSPPGRGPG